MNHGVNFDQDVNSAHVSIVIYLRLQGTSIQPFISSDPTLFMPCWQIILSVLFFNENDNNVNNNKKKKNERKCQQDSKYLSSSPLVNIYKLVVDYCGQDATFSIKSLSFKVVVFVLVAR